MQPGDLNSLAEVLDRDPAAQRLRHDLPVWRVLWRMFDIGQRVRGRPPRDANALLNVALGVLPLAEGICFLLCEPDVEIHDLGPGRWHRMSQETWHVPPEMEPHWLIERGHLGKIGSYALYLRNEPLAVGEYGREFGQARTAEAYMAAVRRLTISALIEVGPDGTEWIAVLPTTQEAQRDLSVTSA